MVLADIISFEWMVLKVVPPIPWWERVGVRVNEHGMANVECDGRRKEVVSFFRLKNEVR